ncbi:MAG: RluA family pseudouridine synthase, partial [Pirellulaceae bacterium]|nr:RluA family pseudouridine synthase [Pirellulaceae bacterium]
MSQLDILYEDNHLLVVNKPAGIATMGAAAGEPTIHQLACDYLRIKYQKPGNVFVGVVSRLDTMTSGVIVLARTSKAASRLVPQFGGPQQGKKSAITDQADKIYLAAVEGDLDQQAGTLVDDVVKDDAARRMRVVDQSAAGAKRAELAFANIACTGDVTLVGVKLKTGRKHQIRLQFAERGHAVIGDRKYG